MSERCTIDREDNAIALHDKNGRVPVPCASLTTLMLGPGTKITHAAVRALAENGCLVIWSGEEGVRFYAQGMGETRSARHFLRQVQLWADPAARLQVVRRMYAVRFPEPLDDGLTLRQIRGREGIRVREAYARASRETGVPWKGRDYKRDSWERADPINRALSAAHSCLYGICHAAIVSAGFSPALGFVHTGKMLSFVYDVADLYKADLTIPAAFQAVAAGETDLEGRVRRVCRDVFHHARLLERIVPDIETVLFGRPSAGGADDDLAAVLPGDTAADGSGAAGAGGEAGDVDADPALPGGLWDPDVGTVAGGVNQADLLEQPTVSAPEIAEPGGVDTTDVAAAADIDLARRRFGGKQPAADEPNEPQGEWPRH
jgi:CRISPR-associated protein Cas1